MIIAEVVQGVKTVEQLKDSCQPAYKKQTPKTWTDRKHTHTHIIEKGETEKGE